MGALAISALALGALGIGILVGLFGLCFLFIDWEERV
jgi:hypothetical protein